MERHTSTVDPLCHLEGCVPLLVPSHVGRTLAHFRLCKHRYRKKSEERSTALEAVGHDSASQATATLCTHLAAGSSGRTGTGE